MKYLLLTYLLTAASFRLLGQQQDTWTAFQNKDSSLTGFKDKDGIVKIEPRFSGFTRADKFDDIMVVTEDKNDTWNSYYLTKAGRIVGRDSLHMFDNSADCESEGYIRFRDRATGKAGMFNKNGDIVIPAAYNELSRVQNGMVIALQGAEKKHWGEHFVWKGGREMIIDVHNNMLVDSFRYPNSLNFYSVLISSQPNSDSIRHNFKAADGRYYSFIDFEKEFRSWLKTSLLSNFTKQNLLAAAYDEISFWKEPNGWTSEAKSSFLGRNYELIRTKLLALNAADCDYDIYEEELNPYTYTAARYRPYFNNCGEAKVGMYPIENVVISYKDKKDLVQDHFEFLRTDEGYKLISVTIRKGALH